MKHTHRKHFGLSLIDVAVGICLVGAAAAALTQVVVMCAEHQTAQREKQNAADLLVNLSEMVDLQTLAQLKPESPEYQEIVKPLQTLTANTLPDGTLKIEPLPLENEAVLVVRFTVSWNEGKRELEYLRLAEKPNFNNVTFSFPR